MIEATYAGHPILLENSIRNESLLDAVALAATWFHRLMSGKKVVAVADKERYRIYIPAVDMDHGLQAGSELVEGSVMYRVIAERKKVVMRTDAKVFGFPYIARCVPIQDAQLEVIGGLILCERVDQQDKLLSIAEQMTDIGKSIGLLLETLTNSSEQLFRSSEELKNLSELSHERVSVSATLLTLIKTINADIKILGFNAAIEAARARDHGRGFAVVSGEMRKMADTSNKSLQKIEEVLTETKTLVQQVSKKSSVLESNAKNQAESITTIYSSIEQLQAITCELEVAATALVNEN